MTCCLTSGYPNVFLRLEIECKCINAYIVKYALPSVLWSLAFNYLLCLNPKFLTVLTLLLMVKSMFWKKNPEHQNRCFDAILSIRGLLRCSVCTPGVNKPKDLILGQTWVLWWCPNAKRSHRINFCLFSLLIYLIFYDCIYN